jgi:membrane protein
MRIGSLGTVWQIIFATFTGIIIGYVLVPISLHTKHAHKGYSLYNVGFSCGIIATVVVSIMRSVNITMETRKIWDTTHNEFSVVILTILFLLMIIASIIFGGKTALKKYISITCETSVGGVDFLVKYGDFATLLNMGINGLFSTWAVYILKGDLNGPTIGSIFCIVGFSATGKHIKNIFPIMLGVYIASLLKIWELNEPAPILTLLLSTTLAPIAGTFGFEWGIIAGFIHSSVALQVGVIYHGANLYNNGFAGGIVAIFLVPVIEAINERKQPTENFD